MAARDPKHGRGPIHGMVPMNHVRSPYTRVSSLRTDLRGPYEQWDHCTREGPCERSIIVPPCC